MFDPRLRLHRLRIATAEYAERLTAVPVPQPVRVRERTRERR